jgi:hypothetical protein
VTRTVTVLVIACPHALGLAILLVIAISTEQAARAGVLIKNRMALERMRTMDVVPFDKTGTLTTIATAPGEEANALLALAAAVESDRDRYPLTSPEENYCQRNKQCPSKREGRRDPYIRSWAELDPVADHGNILNQPPKPPCQQHNT